MNIFIATLKTIVADTQSETFQQANNEHSDYYSGLISQGKFLMSGPILMETGQFDGGVFVIQAKNRKEADTIMSHDPMVNANFANYELMEFKPMLTHPALERIVGIE